MLDKRIFTAGALLCGLLLVCLIRVGWLQLVPPHVPSHAQTPVDWKKASVAQRERRLVLDTGRGDFVDRNGKVITGVTYHSLALFPSANERGSSEELKRLADLLGVREDKLREQLEGMIEPSFWMREGSSSPYRLNHEQKEQISRMHLAGIRVVPYRSRTSSEGSVLHMIGYVSQHPEWMRQHHARELAARSRRVDDIIGGAGLEKSLDELLRGTGASSIAYYTDGRNRPLRGLDARISQPHNPYYPLQVITTLDLELQRKIEEYAKQQGLAEGAIVVLDTRNADVLASISMPMLKPEDQPVGSSAWTNHALKAAVPGSVFKLVTEAAALETKAAREGESFNCEGEYGKYGLSCWKEGGHGHLTLREGLAQSCNIVFAAIAERLSAGELQRTAQALGIGRRVGWATEGNYGPLRGPIRLLEEEEGGRVFATAADPAGVAGGGGKSAVGGEGGANSGGKSAGGRERGARDGGLLAQSGIGQRDVLMSPLQAANLMVTLLHHGRVMQPRLVQEIRYANGQRMVKLAPQEAPAAGYGRIHSATAEALLRGMEAVVDHGTGRSIRQGTWALAGKSGTAEVLRAGAALDHQWFAGYGPAKSPRYAVAVLAENRSPDSSHQATQLFRGVMDLIAAHEAEHARKPAR
ncbi:peptidoglycan D,D-transpeptidase FtsI family protein [Paenibacillus sp. GCM10023252]|uniref:peptidoglycan D,D-transpeptidase FtsI family protein n=1 Tax=Paenibacillus sp. GCM10023252 TaxID=3252649 RepID=UPI003616E081